MNEQIANDYWKKKATSRNDISFTQCDAIDFYQSTKLDMTMQETPSSFRPLSHCSDRRESVRTEESRFLAMPSLDSKWTMESESAQADNDHSSMYGNTRTSQFGNDYCTVRDGDCTELAMLLTCIITKFLSYNL